MTKENKPHDRQTRFPIPIQQVPANSFSRHSTTPKTRVNGYTEITSNTKENKLLVSSKTKDRSPAFKNEDYRNSSYKKVASAAKSIRSPLVSPKKRQA